MDIALLSGIVISLLVLLISALLLKKKKEEALKEQQQQPGQLQVQEGVPRRAQIARNQRNRLRQHAVGGAIGPVGAAAVAAAGADNVMDNSDVDSDGEGPQGQVLDEKMGTKKRAKLEAKEQKRLMREHELKQREERKVKEAKLEEERKKEEEKEAEVERKKAEAERFAREERERREQEEYLKMKEAFTVDEEGYEEGDAEEKENLLQKFVQHIKNNKVVMLEDLAHEFKLKTQQAIERIQELQVNGTLTGVIDDRGKFIYVSEDELLAVAKFIRQHGRVSIAELAESSNNLINLTPVGNT